MKIIILQFITFLVIFNMNSLLFCQWILTNPYPVNSYIQDIDFINNETGWMAGGDRNALICKTTNGGVNWRFLKPINILQINSIKFKDANTGIACGNDKRIYRTSNGGENWTQINFNHQNNYFFFKVNYNNGKFHLLGTTHGSHPSLSCHLMSSDNGLTWNTQEFNNLETFHYLYDLSFINNTTGFITGSRNILLMTVNGGSTWMRIKFNGINEYSSINKVKFIDNYTGYLINHFHYNDRSDIYKTTDSGYNWYKINNGIDTTVFYADLFFDQNKIIIIGSKVFFSENGGNNWINSPQPENIVRLNNISRIDNKTLISCQGQDKYYKSLDNGLNWIKLGYNQVNGYMNNVKILDQNNIIISANSLLYRSTDRGLNWEEIKNVVAENFYFPDSKTGYSVSDLNSKRFKTTNGGFNWINISETLYRDPRRYSSLNFLNSNTGVIAGFKSWKGFILFTTNGGNNWIEIKHDTLAWAINNIWITNPNTFYASINHLPYPRDNVFKTTNRGINWIKLTSNENYSSNARISSLKFLDENTGYYSLQIFDNGSKIFKTTNGGNSWNLIYNGDIAVYDIDINDNNMKIVGGKFSNHSHNGYIYNSTNEGISWTFEDYFSGLLFKKIDRFNGFEILIGDHSSILINNNDNVKVQSENSKIPTNFLLHQNYPNPFNPVTNIKFSLPSTQYTILKIFDITGREITTLVNEQLNAGEYNYQFNADDYGLSSGVYFYRLKAGDVILTKKMLLTK